MASEGKKNLLVSFSGGETSAFMAQWIKYHLEDKVYENVKYVFANTGLENEETLNFIQECDEHFKYNIEWVEASVFQFERKGSGYWTTNFENAKRNGEPFEAVIQKYGIPNQAFPHCTRELKQNPIRAWAKDYFEGEEYDTAIGIRIDEADRMNAKWKENNFIYPLIHRHMIPATKPMVNFYWKNMPFRLQLKGYQGNCATCWKKADKKLFQIYKENPTAYDFMARMEKKYPRVGAEFEKDLNAVDRVFFRKHRSANDMMIEADGWKGKIVDDAQAMPLPSLFDVIDEQDIDLVGGESCEVFSECGS